MNERIDRAAKDIVLKKEELIKKYLKLHNIPEDDYAQIRERCTFVKHIDFPDHEIFRIDGKELILFYPYEFDDKDGIWTVHLPYKELT